MSMVDWFRGIYLDKEEDVDVWYIPAPCGCGEHFIKMIATWDGNNMNFESHTIDWANIVMEMADEGFDHPPIHMMGKDDFPGGMQ